jgi:hypothetical protein
MLYVRVLAYYWCSGCDAVVSVSKKGKAISVTGRGDP